MLKITNIYVGIINFGYNIGRKGLFINFYNCNRRCLYCNANDKYYHINQGIGLNCFTYTVDELLFIISEFDLEHIILSGGEPTIQEDLLELVQKIKENKKYTVTIETNAKQYHDVFKFVDFVIVNIKTYSAGAPYSDMDIINDICMTCDCVTFTCLIGDKKDFDFLAKNFKDVSVWCFLEDNNTDFNEYVSKFLTNDNWRVCIRLDRVLRVDWESSYKRYKSDLND